MGKFSLSLSFFSPGFVDFWDFKIPQGPASERVPCCLETSPPSRLHPQDGSPSLTLLTLFLSFIFCPTSFQKEWAAFLGAWCPPPVFRSCFVEVSHHSDDLLMNLLGIKWFPCPISPPSWDCTLDLFYFICYYQIILTQVLGAFTNTISYMKWDSDNR